MYHKLLAATLLLIIHSFTGVAQSKKYDMSDPVDLELEGVNKVLCMKNGNTMLFHFQIGKGITVKIFDSLHKEIASTKTLTRIFDLGVLRVATFKGLIDINNEGVLFIEQEHLSKYQLVRLRFNSADGTLINEELVCESKSLKKRTRSFVMTNEAAPGYAIFFFTEDALFQKCDAFVNYYDGKHQLSKNVTLDVDRKKYDAADAVGAEMQPNGICITLALSKMKTNGTSRNIGYGSAAVYDHDLAVYFIDKNSNVAKQKVMDVTDNIFSYYSLYTYNSFARNLNLLLVSYVEVSYKVGLFWTPGAIVNDVLVKLNENDLAPKATVIKNKIASTSPSQNVQNGKGYEGMPVKIYTNDSGISMMISEYCMRQANDKTKKYPKSTLFGDICLTWFDSDGNEVSGIILPKAQMEKGLERYYQVREISMKWQDAAFFDDVPEVVYERQFVSINTFNKGGDIYIIYNDADENINSPIGRRGTPVYNFGHTNTACYKITRENEITRQYLFGEPAGDNKVSFIEGADCDVQRGTYAALTQYTKGDAVSLRMAWSRLQ